MLILILMIVMSAIAVAVATVPLVAVSLRHERAVHREVPTTLHRLEAPPAEEELRAA